jgi:hypothetical protein
VICLRREAVNTINKSSINKFQISSYFYQGRQGRTWPRNYNFPSSCSSSPVSECLLLNLSVLFTILQIWQFYKILRVYSFYNLTNFTVFQISQLNKFFNLTNLSKKIFFTILQFYKIFTVLQIRRKNCKNLQILF